MLLDLVKADRVQSGLFDRPDDVRSQARLRALDKLNRRFGRDTVSYAAAGVRRGWSMQRGSLSPRTRPIGMNCSPSAIRRAIREGADHVRPFHSALHLARGARVSQRVRAGA